MQIHTSSLVSIIKKTSENGTLYEMNTALTSLIVIKPISYLQEKVITLPH
jgi:hypothetical protein